VEITEDALCVGAIEADYGPADRMGRELGAVLARVKEIRITSPWERYPRRVRAAPLV